MLCEKKYYNTISDARLFQLRRKEKNRLLEILEEEPKYERRYRLMTAGYTKLIEVNRNIYTAY